MDRQEYGAFISSFFGIRMLKQPQFELDEENSVYSFVNCIFADFALLDKLFKIVQVAKTEHIRRLRNLRPGDVKKRISNGCTAKLEIGGRP